MKCNICNSKIKEGVLKKIVGTYVKNANGKKKIVCNVCQSKLNLDEIKSKI